MREIKFKGLRVDGKVWVYGYYACYYGIHYIKSIEVNKRFGCGVEVIPESVGQFTGLQDKNGVDIYEGDIVRFEVAYSYESEYKDPRSCYRHSLKKIDVNVKFQSGCFVLADDNICEDQQMLWCWENLEVIGNIHESKI